MDPKFIFRSLETYLYYSIVIGNGKTDNNDNDVDDNNNDSNNHNNNRNNDNNNGTINEK